MKVREELPSSMNTEHDKQLLHVYDTYANAEKWAIEIMMGCANHAMRVTKMCSATPEYSTGSCSPMGAIWGTCTHTHTVCSNTPH